MSTLTEPPRRPPRPRPRRRADLSRGDQRRARRRDGATTRRRCSWARTSPARAASSRRTSGCREVRAGARPQHADLRERLPRRRPRHGRHGHAARRRDHVRRLPADGRRRDRQPAAQVPLHVRRPVRGAGHGPRHRRRDRPVRDPAQRHRRELVHAPARHAVATAGSPGSRPTACSARRSGRRPGHLLRAQGPVRAQGPGRPRPRHPPVGKAGLLRRVRRHDRRDPADGRAALAAADRLGEEGIDARSSTFAGFVRSTSTVAEPVERPAVLWSPRSRSTPRAGAPRSSPSFACAVHRPHASLR